MGGRSGIHVKFDLLPVLGYPLNIFGMKGGDREDLAGLTGGRLASAVPFRIV